MKCGQCFYIRLVEGQAYHDCRESSPSVVVSGFRPNPAQTDTSFGKIMTVWPRVSEHESGCGRFRPRVEEKA